MMAAEQPPPISGCSIVHWGSLTNTAGVQKDYPSWLDFFETLKEPLVIDRKLDLPGFMTGKLKSSRRGSDNVSWLTALVVDLDHLESLEQVKSFFYDCFGFVYTTHTHTAASPRARAILPFSRPVTVEEFRTLWQWGNARTKNTLDQPCKDPGRLWFMPGVRPGGLYESFYLDGKPIDVDEVLREMAWRAEQAQAKAERERASRTYTQQYDEVGDRLYRARHYLSRVDPAVTGEGGGTQTFRTAMKLMGFGLDEAQVLDLMWSEYNPRCKPPWDYAGLARKVHEAFTKSHSGPAPGAMLEERRREVSSSEPSPLVMDVPEEPTTERKLLGVKPITVGDPPQEAVRRNYICAELNLAPGAPNGFFAFSFGGKSIILAKMFLDLCMGRPVFGKFPSRGPMRGLWIDYEQGPETEDRFHRLMRAEGLTGADLDGRLELAVMPLVYMNSPNAEEELRKALVGFDFALIDTHIASTPGVNENEATASQTLYMLGRVSAETGCTLLVAGHTGKVDLGGEKRDGRTAPRGSSAIIGACGSAYHITGGAGEPKRLHMIKGRSLGGVQVEDFELELKAIKVHGYENPENRHDPGGFTVKYVGECVDHGEPDEKAGAYLEYTINKALEYLRSETRAGRGVAGATALGQAIKVRSTAAKAAFETLELRGLAENRPHADRGSRPRWFAKGAQ